LKGAPLKILIGLGLLLGAGVGLVAVILMIGFVATQFPQSRKSMELSGWSAAAPGTAAPDQKMGQTLSKIIVNRRTNSEFSLGTVDLPPAANMVGTDQFLQEVKSRITDIREDRPVERAGLKGFHVKGRASFNPALATFEFFLIPGNKLLILSYLDGVERQRVGVGKTRLDLDRIESIDDPEAFFASLRRAGD